MNKGDKSELARVIVSAQKELDATSPHDYEGIERAQGFINGAWKAWEILAQKRISQEEIDEWAKWTP